MRKQTFLVIALVGILAACTPVAQPTQSAPSLPPTVRWTPTQSQSPTSTPLPSPTLPQTLSPTPASSDETVLLPSPDGQWKVILDREVGSLEVEDAQGVKQTVFPPGSTVGEAKWSPDSRRLAVVLSHLPEKPDQGQSIESPEIRLITFECGAFHEAEPGYMAGEAAGGQFLLGAWSPDSRRLLFWSGPLSASLQADGFPLWVLEIERMQAARLAEVTLVNPSYQNWAPDGRTLVFTNGGYRSAQVKKWLSLYQVASGQVSTLIPEDKLIPGQVAWSPGGDTIAFAAVEASLTGEEWADWMGWDNPAIRARRIYLLDPQAGEYQRLNQAEAYQDAPRWSTDGKTLYYVQIDGDQADLMGADPATGEAQPLTGCQILLPDRAGYYGQMDWTDLYENCPEAIQSFTPAPASLSAPGHNNMGQIEAIDAIRNLFRLPGLPLEYTGLERMINSPNGDLSVALYQDTEGRNYLVEPESNQVVEIDARAALSTISSDAIALSQDELRTKAEELIRIAIPDFGSIQTGLSYEEGVKGVYFFCTWRASHLSGSVNRPFAQIGLHKSGELFAYYNTLNQNEKAGATITGQVIAGYGDHQPVARLPLRIRQREDDNWDTYTDGNGYFTLTDLPVGRVDVEDSHLTFQVTIDTPAQSINPGKLKYPLIHPPDYYWWQAAPLADFNQLLDKGVPVDFEVCAADPSWVRPGPDTQRERVYAQPPFSQLDEKSFEKFEQIAILYDTVDVTQQSFPGGLNLDELGTDWLYLTGLWMAANNPISNSDCSYASVDLRSLFDRSQLEIWLFGYQATGVQKHEKESAEFAEGALCDPNERSCTVRPGYHYAVHVLPAPGFQIIRFAGEQDVLAIHIIESGKEILALP